MFKENIVEFINKIVSKIVDISTFATVMELIDIDRIKEKIKDYYSLLKEKYELIIKNQIQTLKEEEDLNKAVKILSEFISRIFKDEGNNNFLDEKIGKLDDKVRKLIYNELMRTYNDKKYQQMKEYIFKIFLEQIEDIDSIIQLVDSLKEEDKKDFLEELLKRCEFTKEEFYSNTENKKIKILCSLNKKGVLNIKYNVKIEDILDQIKDELEKKEISKKTLEEFLNINKEDKNKKKEGQKEEYKKDESNEKIKYLTIQKLELLKLVLGDYDSIKKYGELKKLITDINEEIKNLNYIKNSLIVFHQKTFREEIKQLTNIIKDMETKKIKEFQIQATKESINKLLIHKPKCDEINKVKDFLLFKKIFEKAQGRDQEERFNDSLSKLKSLKKKFKENSLNIEKIFENYIDDISKKEVNIINIFKSIKEDLSKKEESISDKFIEQMADYFDIKEKDEKTNDENEKTNDENEKANDENIKINEKNKKINEKNKKKNDLSIIIKSKRYEMVVKSIKFFFENFQNKQITLPKNIELSEMKLEDLKRSLKKLQKDNIYDYDSKNSYYYKVFTSFYEKKEAIDFLISKLKTGIDYLKIKLDPTTRSLSIKDIKDAIDCLQHIKELINKNNSSEIMNYLKYLDDKTINKFVNYSKHYPSIIELDRKTGKDIFEEVYKIIEDASLIFKLDNEYFYYKMMIKKLKKKLTN